MWAPLHQAYAPLRSRIVSLLTRRAHTPFRVRTRHSPRLSESLSCADLVYAVAPVRAAVWAPPRSAPLTAPGREAERTRRDARRIDKAGAPQPLVQPRPAAFTRTGRRRSAPPAAYGSDPASCAGCSSPFWGFRDRSLRHPIPHGKAGLPLLRTD